MCAKIFSNDDELRSKYMGIILSSEALGVLTGYTVGAFVYSLYGKSTVFAMIGLIVLTNTGIEAYVL